MNTAIALSGKIKSGKSTIAQILAERLNCPYVSFSQHVRQIASERGLPATRKIWQSVGEELAVDAINFCQAVLQQADWKPGQSIVIDGVRHVHINELLRKLVAPSKYLLVYIEAPETTRMDRIKKNSVADFERLSTLESHSTELQVKTEIPNVAELIVKVDDSYLPDRTVDEILTKL